MIYPFMEKHSKTFPVVKMAQIFEIHRSDYYAWKNKASLRNHKGKEDQRLIKKIEEIQKKSKNSFGSPRMTDKLKSEGESINHKKVSRLMRENRLNFKKKKKYKVTTESNHKKPVAPNILNRDFHAEIPNHKWVSDITYIQTAEGWLYLCVILDLYSRKVVGWAVSSRIDSDLILKAFWAAVILRNPPKGLIFHSDRGVQYCSDRFRNALKSRGMVQSMSRKGNCWDNACSESFFKSIKTEWLYDEKFRSRQEARNMVFEYIEVFYNRYRTHSVIGYMAPDEYEFKRVA